MRVLFITQYDERGASSRCRVYQYLPHLAARGIEGEVVPRMPSAAELWRQAGDAQAVFLQKRLPSLEKLLLLRRRAPRLLFDFDDAIWLRRDDDGAVRPASLRKRLRLVMTLRFADAVVAGNQYLAAYARRWNPNVAVLPTPIDASYYATRPQPDSLSSPVLGWVGHPDNLCYLQRLEPALAALAGRCPELALRVICSEPYESPSIRVENVPWSLKEEVTNLQALDVGLMPLDDDRWTRGKCGYKALQYMAVGVPVVCSPVGMNQEIIVEGETGLLAGDLDAWERQLSRLIDSSELRQRLGAAGRQFVEQNYSLTSMAPRLADLLAPGGKTQAQKARRR
jgi:glycosyltransferase involved in cell wall biosynthesis